jgi:putative transposase
MGPGPTHPNESGEVVHTSTGLYAHLSWHTWRSNPSIEAAEVPIIVDAFLNSAKRCKVRIHSQSILTDHIHMLITFLPNTSISAFVREAKSESTRRVNERGENGMTLRWQRGFYADSISRTHVPRVRVYIGCQYAHHPDRIPR